MLCNGINAWIRFSLPTHSEKEITRHVRYESAIFLMREEKKGPTTDINLDRFYHGIHNLISNDDSLVIFFSSKSKTHNSQKMMRPRLFNQSVSLVNQRINTHIQTVQLCEIISFRVQAIFIE